MSFTITLENESVNNSDKVETGSQHSNAFGFLRLGLSSLVIASHIAETTTGDRSIEPLHRIFQTITFGNLAVYCFFIISGYLISGSYLNSISAKDYFAKRVFRIYPAFIVASLVCIFVVAPIGGSHVGYQSTFMNIGNIFILQAPEAYGVFRGTHYPALNGSMWTIAYEFRCYILVPIMAFLGIFRKIWIIPMLSFALLLSGSGLLPFIVNAVNMAPHHPNIWLGHAPDVLVLNGMFLSGSAYYVYRDKIIFKHRFAILSLLILIPSMFFLNFAILAIGLFGSYLILYVAKIGKNTILCHINNKNDISYGVYLYAWPVGKIIQWWWPNLEISFVFLATLSVSYILGWVSWHLIEKPSIKWVKKLLSTQKTECPLPPKEPSF